MGLRHLRQIEDMIRKGPPISKTRIRDTLNTDMSIVEEALSYLLSKRTIEKIGGKIIRYRMRNKNGI